MLTRHKPPREAQSWLPATLCASTRAYHGQTLDPFGGSCGKLGDMVEREYSAKSKWVTGTVCQGSSNKVCSRKKGERKTAHHSPELQPTGGEAEGSKHKKRIPGGQEGKSVESSQARRNIARIHFRAKQSILRTATSELFQVRSGRTCPCSPVGALTSSFPPHTTPHCLLQTGSHGHGTAVPSGYTGPVPRISLVQAQ